jgi:ribosome-associated protein
MCRSNDRTSPRTDALINMVSSEAASMPLPPPTGHEPRDGSLVHIVMGCLDDAKAEDTTLIDLHGKTAIADAMIVTTGRSNVHVNSIADRVMRAIKEAGFGVPRVEGLVNGDWVLIDAGDIIVHVFRPEVRQFYNLEKMWGADRPRPA